MDILDGLGLVKVENGKFFYVDGVYAKWNGRSTVINKNKMKNVERFNFTAIEGKPTFFVPIDVDEKYYDIFCQLESIVDKEKIKEKKSLLNVLKKFESNAGFLKSLTENKISKLEGLISEGFDIGKLNIEQLKSLIEFNFADVNLCETRNVTPPNFDLRNSLEGNFVFEQALCHGISDENTRKAIVKKMSQYVAQNFDSTMIDKFMNYHFSRSQNEGNFEKLGMDSYVKSISWFVVGDEEFKIYLKMLNSTEVEKFINKLFEKFKDRIPKLNEITSLTDDKKRELINVIREFEAEKAKGVGSRISGSVYEAWGKIKQDLQENQYIKLKNKYQSLNNATQISARQLLEALKDIQKEESPEITIEPTKKQEESQCLNEKLKAVDEEFTKVVKMQVNNIEALNTIKQLIEECNSLAAADDGVGKFKEWFKKRTQGEKNLIIYTILSENKEPEGILLEVTKEYAGDVIDLLADFNVEEDQRKQVIEDPVGAREKGFQYKKNGKLILEKIFLEVAEKKFDKNKPNSEEYKKYHPIYSLITVSAFIEKIKLSKDGDLNNLVTKFKTFSDEEKQRIAEELGKDNKYENVLNAFESERPKIKQAQPGAQ